MEPVEPVPKRISELAEAAWTLAAVAAFLRHPTAGLGAEHGMVLGQAGLADRGEDGRWRPVEGLSELSVDPHVSGTLNLVGNLRQMVAAASGATGWSEQDHATLRAQGDASSAAVPGFLSIVATKVPDLQALLRKPGAVMLDAGTGTGGIATGLCSAIPTLRVVGIDVLADALALAQERAVVARVAERLELRRQDVVDIADREVFDVAWLPVVFVSPTAVRAALPRLRRALKPGGVMIFGIAGYRGATRSGAITAWRVVSDGGTPWTRTQMAEAATAAGFTDVTYVPALPGTTDFLIARRADPAEV